jgi:hypothetical protein
MYLVYNLKQMADTFLFLREQHIKTFAGLYEKTDAAVSRFDDLNRLIRDAETKMAANLAMQKHIQNYARTRDIYAAYCKSGYSKSFFEAHRTEITLHKAAKEAFDAAGTRKLPSIRSLREDYAKLLAKKKQAYPEYREAKRKMQDYLKARQNVESFYGEDLKKEREEAKNQREDM